MTELRTCAHCGTAEGELTEFNGRLYCPDCLDDLTLVCTDCGSRFLRIHNRSENDDFPICPECYDRDYTRCVRCGRIIDTDHCWYPLDNDDPYCADCCSTIENSPIPTTTTSSLTPSSTAKAHATSAWNWRSMTVVNVTAARRH